MIDHRKFPVEVLREWVKGSRQKTFQLVADLTDDQMMGNRSYSLFPGILGFQTERRKITHTQCR